MFTRRYLSWRATSVAAVLVALFASVLVRQPSVRGQSSSQLKLSTVLADLASTVPQDVSAGATPASSRQPLAIASLTPSVRDAMGSRRLRLDAGNDVQVSVLVDAVADDRLAQLVAAGAIVEIPDVARPARAGARARVAARARRVAAVRALRPSADLRPSRHRLGDDRRRRDPARRRRARSNSASTAPASASA